MIKLLLSLVVAATLASCVSPDMNRAPDRWIRVIDSDKQQPVKNLDLVYHEFAPYGIIAREVLISRRYRTDENGRAHVPSNVDLGPFPGSRYRIDRHRHIGKALEATEATDILYVRTHENYMAAMNFNR